MALVDVAFLRHRYGGAGGPRCVGFVFATTMGHQPSFEKPDRRWYFPVAGPCDLYFWVTRANLGWEAMRSP